MIALRAGFGPAQTTRVAATGGDGMTSLPTMCRGDVDNDRWYLMWETADGRHFELELLDNGLVEWFYTDRKGTIAGSEDPERPFSSPGFLKWFPTFDTNPIPRESGKDEP